MGIFNLIRFELAICLGKCAAFFSQMLGRGGGTAVSGLVDLATERPPPSTPDWLKMVFARFWAPFELEFFIIWVA